MKKYIVALMASFACTGLFAQGEMDAIRLSGNDLRGTARGQAMGGAFGALGGDVTGILINPAGLGVYRSSEINATLAIHSTSIQTDWETIINKQETSKINFDNISYVGYYPTGNSDLPVLNFSFSYNRLKNFNRSYTAAGQGMRPSLGDYIAGITNGIPFSDMNATENYNPYNNYGIPWLSTLGWQGYLINDVSNDSYSGLFRDETVSPTLSVTERGHIDSYNFSLGTNFEDKLYLGLSVALTDISYVMSSSYGERFSGGGDFSLDNSFETQGDGMQFIFGGIWRPVDFLRLGVAYHSPTWYSLTDSYQAHTLANYEGVDPNTWAKTPDDGWTPYRFKTPSAWVFSAASIIGTKAIVSADYEWKNYTQMSVMDPERREKPDNEFIREDFKPTLTVRMGMEYRFTPAFSGRIGYSIIKHPYEQTFKDGEREVVIVGTVPHYTIEGNINHYTAGIGYRITPQFYIDATFVYRTQQDHLHFFPLVDENLYNSLPPGWNNGSRKEPATLANRTGKGLITVGYKF
jgi:hypothetical protein